MDEVDPIEERLAQERARTGSAYPRRVLPGELTNEQIEAYMRAEIAKRWDESIPLEESIERRRQSQSSDE